MFWFVVCAATATHATGQTSVWNNAAGGSYDTAGNWTPSGIPGSAATLDFGLNNTYTVTMPTGRPATTLHMDAGTVTFASSGAITNGLVLSQDLNLTTGLLTLNDCNFILGDQVNINTGGRMRVLNGRLTADTVRLGLGGGDGSLIISGVNSSMVLISSAGANLIGQNGFSGTLSIVNGATAAFGGGSLLLAASGFANSTGMLAVGINSTVTVGTIAAGTGGFAGQAGTISVVGDFINGAALLTQTGAAGLTLGASANSAGVLTIGDNATFTTGTGGITVNNTGSIFLGQGDLVVNGNLNVNGGLIRLDAHPFTPFIHFANGLTVTVQNGGLIDRTASSTSGSISTPNNGTLLVTGAGSVIRDIGVGVSPGGTLIVSNGGKILDSNNFISMSLGSGTMIVDGGGVTNTDISVGGGTAAASTPLIVRNNGTISAPTDQLTVSMTQPNVARSVTIDTGGSVTMREMWLAVHDGTNSTGQVTVGVGGTLALNGGTAATTRMLLGGGVNVGTLNVLSGGTLVTGAGSVDVKSNGYINLAGRWNTGAGVVHVDATTVTQSPGALWSTVAGTDILVDNGGQLHLVQLPVASGGSLTVSGPGSIAECGTFNVTLSGAASVLGGGSLGAAQIVVSHPNGARLLVDGAGSTADFTGMTVGTNGGDGTVVVSNGARLSVNGVVTSANSGSLADGFISVAGAASMTANSLSLAPQATGNQINSTLSVDGFGSAFSVAGNTTVGPSAGTGGGQLAVTGGGRFNSGTGTFTLNPLGRVDVIGGTFTANGATTINGQLNVGGAQATQTPITGRFEMTAGHALTVGATGSLNLFENGVLSMNAATLNTPTINFNGGSFNFNAGTVAFTSAITPDAALLANLLGPQATLFPGHALTGAATVTLASTMILDGGTFSAGTMSPGTGNNLILRSGRFSLTSSPLTVGSGGAFGQLNLPAGLTFAAQGAAGTITSGGVINLDGGTFSAASNLIVNPGGQLRLSSPASRIASGTIQNSGLIAGTGRIDAVVTNTGVIRANGGDQLTLAGPNPVGNAGTIQLLGGAIEFLQPLTNNANGTINGQGSLFTAGLTNSGSVALTGGEAMVFGGVTNNPTARVLVTAGANATFYDPVSNVSGSQFKVSDASVAAFLSPVTGLAAFTGNGTTIFESTATAGALAAGTSVVEPAGSLFASSVRQPALIVRGDTRIAPNGTDAGTSRLGELTIDGAPGAWTGRLDLADNDLVVDYAATASSPLVTIRDQIKSGFAGGAWTGNGITSSAAAAAALSAHRTALGYAEASTLGVASFSGQTVDATSVLVRYTLAGDANLSGTVDLTDFTFLAANFNGSGKSWLHGDFNYDGSVDLTDFTFLASNFNGSVLIADGGSLGSSLPEPTIGLVVCAALIVSTGRGRHRGAP